VTAPPPDPTPDDDMPLGETPPDTPGDASGDQPDPADRERPNLLSPRLFAALAPTPGSVQDDGDTLVVRVDFVDRRYRDAIKAGARPVEAPRDEAGMGVWRRVARLHDQRTDRPVTIWSSRG